MIFEPIEKLADRTIVRRREAQTELAKWEQVGPRCWVRKLREERCRE